jgi:hypothetical protein
MNDRDSTHTFTTNPTKRALYACWWFIENVNADDPHHNDIFFELREIVRRANHESGSPP